MNGLGTTYFKQTDHQEQCWTVPPCPDLYLYGRPVLDKTDDVVTEHGGLLHVPPLAIHLKFLMDKQAAPI